MRRLRAECAWKREQTHRSLQRYLLEETYETLEAIDIAEETGDRTHLRDELGDLLLQVVFHAAIAEEAGEFDLDDVARAITAKMIRRNRHVFGEAGSGGEMDSSQIEEMWQDAKAAERSDRPPDPLPPGLPALLAADKTLQRRERTGSPVAVDPAAADIGERLLAVVADARAVGVDPEQALRDVVRRLESGA